MTQSNIIKRNPSKEKLEKCSFNETIDLLILGMVKDGAANDKQTYDYK